LYLLRRFLKQLGYVVNSYYDLSFTSHKCAATYLNDQDSSSEGMISWVTTPIDMVVINILSKKASPPEVALRIEEFLIEFRDSLSKMPSSEINDHASSLSKQLMKPIQKLGDEASFHFSKIHHYAPEILSRGGQGKDLPWDSKTSLAAAIERLERDDLLQVWDDVVLSENRSRIVSLVYGKSFPLSSLNIEKGIPSNGFKGVLPFKKKSVHQTLDGLFLKRADLKPFHGFPTIPSVSRNNLLRTVTSSRTFGFAAIAVIGASILRFALTRGGDEKKPTDPK